MYFHKTYHVSLMTGERAKRESGNFYFRSTLLESRLTLHAMLKY